MTRKRTGYLLLFAAVLLMCGSAFSQIRETGTIQGTVTDMNGTALPGVTVTVSGESLIGGAKTFITDARGAYRFLSLPPGPYMISAELTGFVKNIRKFIKVYVSMTLTVDFVLEESKIQTEVVVTANAPTIDVKSSASAGTVMTTELLQSIPMGKSMVSLVMQGVGVDPENQSAYGFGTSDNSWMIDGTSVTSRVIGGTTFRPDFNIIQEAAVEGLGLPAEYGEYVGTVITTVTKSGANKFSGLAEIFYNGKNWNSQNLGHYEASEFQNPAAKDAKYSTPMWIDVSAQLGGKIIKDKLWFFISGEKSREKSWMAGVTVPQIGNYNKFFGKLTYQVDSKNRVNLAYNYSGRRDLSYIWDVITSPDLFPNMTNNEWTLTGNWTSVLSQNTLLEGKAAYYHRYSDTIPKKGLDIVGGQELLDASFVGNMPFFTMAKFNTAQGNVHLSHYVENFGGSHEIKVGAEGEYYSTSDISGTPGDETILYLYGNPYMKRYQEAVDQNYKMRVLVGFIQDSWSPTKRLSINIGLRYDNYWFKFPKPSALGVVYSGGNIAPRIGFSYDLLGDRKNVVKVHYGHYYLGLNQAFFQDADDRANESIDYMWTGTDWSEIGRNIFHNNYSVDPNLKQPYVKEYLVAFERELFKDASLSIDAFYKKYYNIVGVVNTLATYEPITIVNPGRDGKVGTSDDSPYTYYVQTNAYTDHYLITNPKAGMTPSALVDPKSVAQGITISFTKKYSNRWQMIASYSLMSSKTNSPQGYYSSVDSDPNEATNAYGDRYDVGRHLFKLSANVLLPWDISLGVIGFIGSGLPFSSKSSFLYNTPDFGYTQLYAEPIGNLVQSTRKNLDLRLEKIFRIPGSRASVCAMADISNVFNDDRIERIRTIYGSKFGKISSLVDPRSIKIGARLIF